MPGLENESSWLQLIVSLFWLFYWKTEHMLASSQSFVKPFVLLCYLRRQGISNNSIYKVG